MVKHLSEKINNQLVRNVLAKLYMPLMDDRIEAHEQVRGIKGIVNVLKKFESFNDNKENILNTKTRFEQAAIEGGFCKILFDASAALGTIYNSFAKKDKNFSHFVKAIELSIELLENRKIQRLEELENQYKFNH